MLLEKKCVFPIAAVPFYLTVSNWTQIMGFLSKLNKMINHDIIKLIKGAIAMIVNATEFKTRAGKYLELAETEDIVITRNGKEVAKLVPIKKQGTPNADYLYGLMADSNSKDTTPEEMKAERIKHKYEGND